MRFFSPTILMVVLCVATLTASPIKIGMSAPMTGPSKQLGVYLLDGIRPTIHYINQHGGINGQPIELVVLDDQYNPELTIQNTHVLINEKKVDLLFSYVGTPTTLQAAPLLIKYNRLLFFPFSGAQVLQGPLIRDHIVRWRPSYLEESKNIVESLFSQQKTRIAVYYQKDAFGQSGLIGIKTALANRQLAPVAIASYKRGKSFESEFNAEAQILLHQRPDAIVCISSYQASAGLIKAVRQTSQIPIVTLSFSDPTSLIKLLKSTPSAVVHLIYSQVVPYEQDIADLDQYKRITHQPFNPIRYEGYKNTIVLADLLKNMTLSDIKKNKKAIEETLDKRSAGALLTWRNGHWVPL